MFGAMLIGNLLIYWSKASLSLDGIFYSMIGILSLNIVKAYPWSASVPMSNPC